MKTQNTSRLTMTSLLKRVVGIGMLAAAALVGCTDLNSGYAPYGSPYGAPPPAYYGSQPYYGGGYYDNGYYRGERRELEQERRRLQDERERLDRERQQQDYRPLPPAARPAPERCPPGFSQSEQKCSSEERRRGCRDMRLPGGLGCVDRR